jgi:hypothetical protein
MQKFFSARWICQSILRGQSPNDCCSQMSELKLRPPGMRDELKPGLTERFDKLKHPERRDELNLLTP